MGFRVGGKGKGESLGRLPSVVGTAFEPHRNAEELRQLGGHLVTARQGGVAKEGGIGLRECEEGRAVFAIGETLEQGDKNE